MQEEEKRKLFQKEERFEQNKYASNDEILHQSNKGCPVNGCNGLGNINKNFKTHYKEKYCPLKNQSHVITCSIEADLEKEKLQTNLLLQIREKNQYNFFS